jgi:hypothetical protein
MLVLLFAAQHAIDKFNAVIDAWTRILTEIMHTRRTRLMVRSGL